MNQFLREPPPTLNRTDSLPKVPVLGARITPLTLEETVQLLMDMVKRKTRGYVCVANVHTTTLALCDDHFRKVLNGAAAVVADGMPVVWRVRAAGHPEAGRVHGADLLENTCVAGVPARLRHGFFGGLPGVAEAMVSSLTERFPAIQVGGVWNPGTIQQGEASPPDLLGAINESNCDVLWVGLGAPKQEIWMEQHRRHLQTPVMVGVGQAFDILGGRICRPPDWMGRNGLEWMYRLTQEPRRLWKRYLYYNSFFLWYLFLESITSSWDRLSTKPGSAISCSRTRRSRRE